MKILLLALCMLNVSSKSSHRKIETKNRIVEISQKERKVSREDAVNIFLVVSMVLTYKLTKDE